MHKPKFKVGDRVRVVSKKSSAGWNDFITLGKTYGVIQIDFDYGGARIFVPEMVNEDYSGEWWLADSCLELVIKPGEQLLFSFMKEED